jgi:DNA-binding transcriptional LysR family regulator
LARFAPQLQALVELDAHRGHMTQAAAALGIPQSSMSRRIRALESDLRMPLLLHAGRTVRLTPAAERLARGVRQPLRDLGLAIDAVAADTDPDHGTARFGFPLTMGSGRVPDLLSEFRRTYPGVKVTLRQAHGSELVDDLLAGDLDLAIVIPPPRGLRHTIIGTQKIHVSLPRQHRLAAARRLRLDELKDETFIANPPTYNLRQLTETWCQQAGFTPDISVEVTEFATIRELIHRNLGIALLPHDERQPLGIAEVPLVGARYERAIALASATATEAPTTRRLSTFLLDHFAESRECPSQDL